MRLRVTGPSSAGRYTVRFPCCTIISLDLPHMDGSKGAASSLTRFSSLVLDLRSIGPLFRSSHLDNLPIDFPGRRWFSASTSSSLHDGALRIRNLARRPAVQ